MYGSYTKHKIQNTMQDKLERFNKKFFYKFFQLSWRLFIIFVLKMIVFLIKFTIVSDLFHCSIFKGTSPACNLPHLESEGTSLLYTLMSLYK